MSWPQVRQGLHPEVAVEEDEGFCHGHRDDLAEAFEGGGEGKALSGPLYAGMGVAEMKLPYLDLPDLPNHHLTPGGGIAPPRRPRTRKNGTADHPSPR